MNQALPTCAAPILARFSFCLPFPTFSTLSYYVGCIHNSVAGSTAERGWARPGRRVVLLLLSDHLPTFQCEFILILLA